jgi:Gpi18-like mannosyltransferase
MNIQKRPFLAAGILFILLSLFLRSIFLEFRNGDLLLIRAWYDFLLENGYRGLANAEFSNYPPAYLYLLYLATLTSAWLNPFIALKLIPATFDILSAFAVYKIARVKYNDDRPIFFAALFFLLPTVIFNSSGWGQIDSLYGSFLLLCFYLLLMERPLGAMLAFGGAFSFKAQTVFLLPFLGIMFLRKRIDWHHFLVVPLVYLILALPAALLGRDWRSILLLYAGQADQFKQLSRNAPNLYSFIPNEFFHPIFEIGTGIFIVSMLAWAWINYRAKPPVTQNQLALTALASAILTVFLLPKMHDRYFYPADLFAFVAVIFLPELWFFAVFSQLSSGLVYLIFPFAQSRLLALPAALINTALVIVIARRQLKSLEEP